MSESNPQQFLSDIEVEQFLETLSVEDRIEIALYQEQLMAEEAKAEARKASDYQASFKRGDWLVLAIALASIVGTSHPNTNRWIKSQSVTKWLQAAQKIAKAPANKVVPTYIKPSGKYTKVGQIVGKNRLPITSQFGHRVPPCPTCSGFHLGTDVGVQEGESLFAPALPGYTASVRCVWNPGGGNTAIIRSQQIPGKTFVAMHLSECKSGTFKAGQVFAETGNTGHATSGPHLHFEQHNTTGTLTNWTSVDPDLIYVNWVLGIPPEASSQEPANKVDSKKPPKKVQRETKFGHFRYYEPDESLLVTLSGSEERLLSDAAIAFEKMKQAALREGVELVPLSGFRSEEQQSEIFYQGTGRSAGESDAERAKVSAPPGFSEHHTGYTIDIGDRKADSTNLSTEFANTVAGKWLKQNAQKYGFENSFFEGNKQGVSYEPWHWRFVGTSNAKQVFAAARQKK